MNEFKSTEPEFEASRTHGSALLPMPNVHLRDIVSAASSDENRQQGVEHKTKWRWRHSSTTLL